MSESFMSPKGTPQSIEFTTDEGTLMSLDVSSDGRLIVFDLLGHIYRMNANGGRAECLTQGSGIALNYHPRFSPDGQTIAFISDRYGQANVWVMRADGSDLRPLYLDPDHRYATPIWAADGRSVFVTRLAPTPGQGWHRRNASIWQIPLRGIPGPVLASNSTQYYVASASPDGRTLYVYSSKMAAAGASIFEVGFRIQALDLSSRKVTDVAGQAPSASEVTTPASSPRLSYDSGGALAVSADIVPIASPDGRYLAFARAEAARGMSYRGHRYRYSTALFVVDLKSGEVHRVLDPITKDVTNGIAHYSDTFLPGYAWMPNSREIVLAADGRIVRVSVDGARVSQVPFEARVHRVISGQVRRNLPLDPDDSVRVRFIQWPAASPDGHRLVFAALGRLWIMDLPAGQPKVLTAESGADVQITPAWAPDGKQLAFATWNDRDRGQVWIDDLSSGRLTQLSTQPGEYIWPTWTPDGAVVAVRGPGAPDIRDAWNQAAGWQAVRLSHLLPPVVLTSVDTPWQPLQIDRAGRIYFAARGNSTVAGEARLPYPDAVTFELSAWKLVSIDAAGGTPRVLVRFPAGPAPANVPVVSKDGRWVAYQADYQVFVERLTGGAAGSERAQYIDPDPKQPRTGKRRVDQAGGVYARWRDNHILEYAAGDRYETFDVDTGVGHVVPISLHFRRDRNPKSLALLNARIITMDADQSIERGSIVVRDGRIACVGQCSTGGVDRVLDLSGKTIIPGLIDVHDHIADESSGVVPRSRPHSLLALVYGVTTVIDPAVSSMTLLPVSEMTDAGNMLGPRTFGAAEGVFDSVGGVGGTPNVVYGALLDIRSEADAEYQVARRAAWGAVVIKNYQQTNRQQQQWLIEAARRHGLSVTAEGSSVFGDLGMIMDGQTGWEHFIPTLRLHRDLASFLGQARATYSPTLSVAGFPDGAMFYYRPRADLPHDPKYRRFASAAVLDAVQPRDPRPPPLENFSFPILAEGVADVIHAGGFATIGEHGENPGIGSHWEIWTYASALKPMDALRMATVFGARFHGLEHDLGSLEVGKFADLVVLNSNPLTQIENTADIAYVMKAGRLYSAVTLKEIDSLPDSEHAPASASIPYTGSVPTAGSRPQRH